MTDKLSIYNTSLAEHLEERSLASLSENREPRRVLDIFWADAVNYCLSQGLWLFAKRNTSLTPALTLTPAFGYTYAFKIPIDWIRTIELAGDQRYTLPLDDYREETGYFYTDTQPIYLQYVSSDNLYGWNLGAWPPTFTQYVALHLARKACKRIKPGDLAFYETLVKLEKSYRIDARGKDAMNEAVGRRPTGTWIRSRRGWMRGGIFGSGSGSMGPTGND